MKRTISIIKRTADWLGAVCCACLSLDRTQHGKLCETHTTGGFQVKIIYFELNKTIKHTGKLANNGLLHM